MKNDYLLLTLNKFPYFDDDDDTNVAIFSILVLMKVVVVLVLLAFLVTFGNHYMFLSLLCTL